mmetsp:Transcript_21760/g.40719  ORF Transcript_21760/g.40719 Transcript_21760/m.40719 type:complete len:530 (+) Transcript_21760:508-2097(+)|eukprot:CAMPEP_0184524866 /NCGR_PEP_ID=MMETSP0198_2-20121128/9768_1 /TAXON_ID=1112570 /ORGANISM="Thraustochytrium sp., Strain LLF1b" /LENGTH=529 /DNA_ID=CAMNT_0026916237 /DNA_START=361 /DNA_END=1950 /DNA_ORIENTATION=+
MAGYTGVLRFLVVCQVILGLFAIAVTVYNLTSDAQLKLFVDILLQVLDPAFEWLFWLKNYGPLISGTFVVVLGVVALSVLRTHRAEEELASKGKVLSVDAMADQARCSGWCGRRGKRAFILSVGLLVLMFLAQGLFAGAFLILVRAMSTSVENIADDDSVLSEFEMDVSSALLATFNLCCFEQGYSVQGEVPSCTGSGEAPACSVPSEFARFEEKLCTCYSSPFYGAQYEALSKTNVCDILAKARVSVGRSDLVPGTNVPVSALVDEKRFFVVGPPEESGCGVGLAKGFQWAQFKFVSAGSERVAIIMILVSILELLLCGILFCTNSADNSDDYFNDIQDELAVLYTGSPRRRANLKLVSFLKTPKSRAKRSSSTAANGGPIVTTKFDLDSPVTPESSADLNHVASTRDEEDPKPHVTLPVRQSNETFEGEDDDLDQRRSSLTSHERGVTAPPSDGKNYQLEGKRSRSELNYEVGASLIDETDRRSESFQSEAALREGDPAAAPGSATSAGSSKGLAPTKSLISLDLEF